MEGGRGARRAASSSSGCSWAAFEETAKDYGINWRAGGQMGWGKLVNNPPRRNLKGWEGLKRI